MKPVSKPENAVFDQCTRFLNGHPPQSPHEILAQLAQDARPEEKSDFYGTGSLIEDFEKEVATLLGKEAAAFMPSGTMAQQIAMRIAADRARLDRIGFHPTSHLDLHENGAYQILHGLKAVRIGEATQIIKPKDLKELPEPIAALLIELPLRTLGGLLPTWDELKEIREWATENRVALHLDGARLWECQPYYGKPYSEICSLFDSVYVSFYKGLGGLAGAILAGDRKLIDESKVWQRRHGGNLIRLYPYVVSARHSLKERLGRMGEYHSRALEIAEALSRVPGIQITPKPPQTNMMHVYLNGDSTRLMESSRQVARDHRIALFRGLNATPLPGWHMFELSVGDGALGIGADEAEKLFRELMDRA